MKFGLKDGVGSGYGRASGVQDGITVVVTTLSVASAMCVRCKDAPGVLDGRGLVTI